MFVSPIFVRLRRLPSYLSSILLLSRDMQFPKLSFRTWRALDLKRKCVQKLDTNWKSNISKNYFHKSKLLCDELICKMACTVH